MFNQNCCAPEPMPYQTLKGKSEELKGRILDCLKTANLIQANLLGEGIEDGDGRNYSDCIDGNLSAANDALSVLQNILTSISDRV